ncbi:hypothetical protein NMD1_01066 [Novosphingobium sp. MD-1]|nr:hypothetical protein NMD1_01066 [Novosphingobium sp. MD-1]
MGQAQLRDESGHGRELRLSLGGAPYSGLVAGLSWRNIGGGPGNRVMAGVRIAF